MLTAEGCKTRIARLLKAVNPTGPLLLGDALNLRYFANAYCDPFSLGADFPGVLKIDQSGRSTLYHDSRVPKSYDLAFADEKVAVKWYEGNKPGHGPRGMILRDVVELAGTGGHIHDALADPDAPALQKMICDMRRKKDPDEIALLRHCMRIGEAGHAWSLANVKVGMTEMEVYAGILSACTLAAGHPVVVYGDFAVSPGSTRRGGMATQQVIQPGDMMILDFSVVVQGYRSDFTNTLVVGAEPTAEQRQMFELCSRAMDAGEAKLKAGASCQAVYEAVHKEFEPSGLAACFGHHAGHGLGVSHPEAPFFVEHSEGILVAGDVVTLEPGLYIDGIGGLRIEHNYLILDGGFERLSNHELRLS